MQGALMWLNQYGCQAVQCEVFLCFLPVLDLTSDRLTHPHEISQSFLGRKDGLKF